MFLNKYMFFISSLTFVLEMTKAINSINTGEVVSVTKFVLLSILVLTYGMLIGLQIAHKLFNS